MSLRTFSSILACLMLLLSSGCASRYQNLLRDRDLEIRDLNGQVSDLRAANAELERREQMARQRLGELESRPVEASSDRTDLADLQKQLPELDVRRNNRGRISIGIENTVTFDSGSDKLKASADGVLRRVAAVLQQEFSGHRIYVEGHTDTDPIQRTRDKYRSNRHLSMERADAVTRYLVTKCGIPERDVAVVGYGPFEPRQPGSSDQAKARNRRVEIVVGETM